MISLIRIIKFSFQDIMRNIWLSIVTIIILVLALFSVNVLLVVDLVSKSTVEAIKEKIDINIHIKNNIDDNEVMALKAKISNFEEVEKIDYISKTQALNNFKVKYKNNPEILDALRELGRNPLSASLVIKPKYADNYQGLIYNLNKLDTDIIESSNFDNHELILGKISSISNNVNRAGLIVSLIFVFITILIVFYSIRIAIYTHAHEIAIMRLVGASHWFIRAPYLMSGLIYAFIGILIVVIAFYPFLSLLQPYLEVFFIDYNVNIFAYFADNFLAIFGLQFIAASSVNLIASLVAVRKHSKV